MNVGGCADDKCFADAARPIVLGDSDYRGRPRCPDDDGGGGGHDQLTVWRDTDESRSDDEDRRRRRQRYGAAFDVDLGDGATDDGSAAAAASQFAGCVCVDAWARLKRIFELTDAELEKTREVRYAYPGDERGGGRGSPAAGFDDDDDASGETLEDYRLDGEYLYEESAADRGGGAKTSAKARDDGKTGPANAEPPPPADTTTARPDSAAAAGSANGPNETAKDGGAAAKAGGGAAAAPPADGKRRGGTAAVETRQSNGGGGRRNAVMSSGKGTPKERPKAVTASGKRRPTACCSAYGSSADNGRVEKENNIKYVYTFGEEYRGGVSCGHRDCVDCLIRVPRHKGWMSAAYVAKRREKANERRRLGAMLERRERTQHRARTAADSTSSAAGKRQAGGNVTANHHHQSAASTGEGDAKRATNAAASPGVQPPQHGNPPTHHKEAAAAVELRKSNGAYTVTMHAMAADGRPDAAADPIVFRLGAVRGADGRSSSSTASSFDVGFVPPAAIRALRPPTTRRDAHTAYDRDDYSTPAERRKVERKTAASTPPAAATAARERHRRP